MDSLDSFIRRVAAPSLVLSDTDVCRVAKLCEVLKSFLADLRGRWLRSHREQPILEAYASDSTPLRTRQRHTAEFEELHAIRSGTSSKDWIVQRCFLRASGVDANVLFSEPKLLLDKTAWTHFEVQRQLCDLARQHHHGIVVSHHCWDRAVKQPCERLVRLRHRAFDEFLTNEEDEPGTATLRILSSWVTAVGCLAHDFHNALKWSAKLYMDNKDVMRSAWIATESLRNGFDLLVSFLPRWLGSCISFEDADDLEVLARFWQMVGLSEQWVQLCVRLQIRWSGGKLKVAEHLEQDDAGPQQIITCLLHLWRFRTWSSSRWCGVGQSCRCMLGCLFVGLEALVSLIMSDEKASKYYISGFPNHLNDNVKRMIGVIAVVSRVSEHPLLVILKDDRLARVREHIEASIKQQVDYVFDLPDGVLDLVASASGMSLRELRHETTQAVCIQLGYIDSKLREVRRSPWTLVGGDVPAKLQSLREGPRPGEEVAGKIWDLLAIGIPQREIMAGIEVLGHAPWTTTCVEQGHSVASSICRKHPKYNRQTLMARAMVHQAACLFNEDPVNRTIGVRTKKIARLRSRRPDRITGRHAFCKLWAGESLRIRDGGGRVGGDITKRVIKNHGKLWRALSENRKAMLRRVAVDMQEESRAAIADRLAKEQEVLRGLRGQQRQFVADGGSCLRLGQCRFSEADRVEFRRLFDSPNWTKAFVDKLRKQASLEVGPPPPPVQAILEHMPLPEAPPKAASPPWLSWLAHNREFFRSAILRFSVAGQVAFYKFVYAKQNPLEVCLTMVTQVEVPEPWFGVAGFAEADLNCWEHTFHMDLQKFVFSDDEGFPVDAELHILSEVVLRGRLLCGDGSFIALHELLALFPEPTRAPVRAREKPEPNVSLEPWMEHPSMWDIMRDGGVDEFAEATKPRPSKAKDGTRADHHTVYDEGEFDGDDSFLDDLWSARERLDAETVGGGEDPFVIAIRGGRWTRHHKGVDFDSYRSQAKPGLPKDFCDKYKMPFSATFSVRTYGEPTCYSLCTYWSHKMKFFYELWASSGYFEGYFFREDDVKTYVPPPEAVALADGASAELQRRLRSMAALRPRGR
jgi:hypothetical protein